MGEALGAYAIEMDPSDKFVIDLKWKVWANNEAEAEIDEWVKASPLRRRRVSPAEGRWFQDQFRKSSGAPISMFKPRRGQGKASRVLGLRRSARRPNRSN